MEYPTLNFKFYLLKEILSGERFKTPIVRGKSSTDQLNFGI